MAAAWSYHTRDDASAATSAVRGYYIRDDGNDFRDFWRYYATWRTINGGRPYSGNNNYIRNCRARAYPLLRAARRVKSIIFANCWALPHARGPTTVPGSGLRGKETDRERERHTQIFTRRGDRYSVRDGDRGLLKQPLAPLLLCRRSSFIVPLEYIHAFTRTHARTFCMYTHAHARV